jgi:hypothetical protein
MSQSHYMKISQKRSAEFNEAVNELVERGADPIVACNVVRWRLHSLKPARPPARLSLTPEQQTPPSVRLAMKVEKGTRPGPPMEHVPYSVKWQHVIVAKSGVMFDRKTQGMFAIDTYL